MLKPEKMQCFIWFPIDYNECNPETSIHIQDCGPGATCTNQLGTYSCQCDTGYEGAPPNCNYIRMYKRCTF